MSDAAPTSSATDDAVAARSPEQQEALMRPRRGLNEAEAVILRLAAVHGCPKGLFDGLEPLGADALNQAQAALNALNKDDKAQALASWLEQDLKRQELVRQAMSASVPRQQALLKSLSPRWQGVLHRLIADAQYREATPHRMIIARQLLAPVAFGAHHLNMALVAQEGDFDLGFLCSLERPKIMRACVRLGIAQIAPLLKQLERRELARQLRELPDELRAWMRDDFGAERQLDAQEMARIREVFVYMTKHFPAWEERALHMGLFFVATSAGDRFAMRSQRLTQLLPAELAQAFDAYLRRSQFSSRRGLDLVVRRSLGQLMPTLREVLS